MNNINAVRVMPTFENLNEMKQPDIEMSKFAEGFSDIHFKLW